MKRGGRSGFCCDEDLARIGCDGLDAPSDLERWRREGPRAETRELVQALIGEGVKGARLLDIGAGVGAVHVLLLEAGAASAVDVDASREYLAAAAGEAERRGLAGRIEYRYGDVVTLAPDLPPVDVVTADAVICCYPFLPEFLAAAARSEPRLVGLTYPHDRWWLRAAMRLMNVWWWLFRKPDRWYLHRHRDVDGLLEEAEYAPVHDGGSWIGRVVVYRHRGATA